MSDCGCDKARAELEEYLRNELSKEDAADIREHMDNCSECADEARVSVVLTDAVRRACAETAPEDLRVQVLARLRGIHEPEPLVL